MTNTYLDYLKSSRFQNTSHLLYQSNPSSKGVRPNGTGSRLTLWLGIITIIGIACVMFLGFAVVPADQVQGDAMRIIFVHVPVAIGGYAAFFLAALGSVMWLLRKSVWWDITAHASAEVGVLMWGLTLLTGMLWGRPTWGTYWDWGDVRLITTLILFLIMVGYLSVRTIGGDSASVSTRSAVVALLGAINMPIVNRSVNWWSNRTLHQKSSLTEGKLEDITLLTLCISLLVAALAITWMMIHRFRIGWLEREYLNQKLVEAITERRSKTKT